MTAKNPRLTITITPALKAQLAHLSALTKQSQAALIAELLEGSQPIFSRLIETLEAAQNAKADMRGRLTTDMRAAQERIESQVGVVLDTFDTVTGDLLAEAEGIQRRARKAPAKAERAVASATVPNPLSNRGVRSGVGTAKKPTKTRG